MKDETPAASAPQESELSTAQVPEQTKPEPNESTEASSAKEVEQSTAHLNAEAKQIDVENKCEGEGADEEPVKSSKKVDEPRTAEPEQVESSEKVDSPQATEPKSQALSPVRNEQPPIGQGENSNEVSTTAVQQAEPSTAHATERQKQEAAAAEQDEMVEVPVENPNKLAAQKNPDQGEASQKTGTSERAQPDTEDVHMEDVAEAPATTEDGENANVPAEKIVTEGVKTMKEPASTANAEKNEEKPTEAEDVTMEDVENVPEKTDNVSGSAGASNEVSKETEQKSSGGAASTSRTIAENVNVPEKAAASGATATPTQPAVVQQTTAAQQKPSSLQPPQLIMPNMLPQGQNAVVGQPRARAASYVGVPAAKRARVNGTLDAGMQFIAPDLSEAVLQRYLQAANEIGARLIATPAGTPISGDRRKDFFEDHARYMASLGKGDYKIRTIGGNKLDLFTLYHSVLVRGGVQSVISTRTFRLVGKALNLPKSCTSAAYILRVDYEKLLYAYEQKHVWGRDEKDMPTLHSTERVKTNAVQVTPMIGRPVQRTRIATAAVGMPQHGAAQAGTGGGGGAGPGGAGAGVSARPKRQAALAASSAVAAAAASDDDDEDEPRMELRARTAGIEMNALTQHQEAIVAEEVNANAPHAVFNPNTPGDRERILQSLWSANSEDVAFALGTFNVLSYDPRNNFQARHFPGLLDALCAIMQRHLEDVEKRRRFGMGPSEFGPKVASMSAMDIRDGGVGNNVLDEEERLGGSGGGGGGGGKVSSLQKYGDMFNCVDNIAVDREQCAVVAVNILRNMSFDEPNAMQLARSQVVMDLAAVLLENVNVPGNLRDGLIDMWINVSSYLHVAEGQPGHPVLMTCVKLLNPFMEGGEQLSRFTNCGEILARLAASPERNEGAFVQIFGELLPRLVDMIGGKDRRYINAGLAALCNCSAFDWPARSRIARVPRCMPRLVNMLTDPELAPRAALTLLNLAEAPSNRSVILAYEKQLVEQAIKVSPASDTVASILFDLSHD